MVGHTHGLVVSDQHMQKIITDKRAQAKQSLSLPLQMINVGCADLNSANVKSIVSNKYN